MSPDYAESSTLRIGSGCGHSRNIRHNRHSFASRLVMSGADLRTVAELLRDSSLAMVMRYTHLAPDYRLAAVERMGVAFAVKRTATGTATGVSSVSTSGMDAVQ
jgi:hypothetical protein